MIQAEIGSVTNRRKKEKGKLLMIFTRNILGDVLSCILLYVAFTSYPTIRSGQEKIPTWHRGHIDSELQTHFDACFRFLLHRFLSIGVPGVQIPGGLSNVTTTATATKTSLKK